MLTAIVLLSIAVVLLICMFLWACKRGGYWKGICEKLHSDKERFEKTIQENALRITELENQKAHLEGVLSGDPHLTATKEQREHWRCTAIRYSNQVEKELKSINLLNDKLSSDLVSCMKERDELIAQLNNLEEPESRIRVLKANLDDKLKQLREVENDLLHLSNEYAWYRMMVKEQFPDMAVIVDTKIDEQKKAAAETLAGMAAAGEKLQDESRSTEDSPLKQTDQPDKFSIPAEGDAVKDDEQEPVEAEALTYVPPNQTQVASGGETITNDGSGAPLPEITPENAQNERIWTPPVDDFEAERA